MAEFKEIMKQARRMCDANCEKCPLGNVVGNICPVAVTGNDEVAEIERIVMDWAKEHPEPRYPNWIDWLYQMGVYRDEKRNGNVHTCCLTENAYLSIPADIAEKLGIKPIGGEGNVK